MAGECEIGKGGGGGGERCTYVFVRAEGGVDLIFVSFVQLAERLFSVCLVGHAHLPSFSMRSQWLVSASKSRCGILRSYLETL